MEMHRPVIQLSHHRHQIVLRMCVSVEFQNFGNRIFSWGRNLLKYMVLDMDPVNWLTLDIMANY